MDKILISNAINNNIQYRVTNNKNIKEFDCINGRLKLNNFKKIKLPINLQIDKEYIDNTIGVLELEYINLNNNENSPLSLRAFYIKDLDDFRFIPIEDRDISDVICEYLNINLQDYFSYSLYKELIPKIKTTKYFFYLLPDEETEYYLYLENGFWEEI